jgi:signal transduction histidine kinase
MRSWLRGKIGGFAAFLVIAALVAGGLGWATAAALRLEQEQLDARAEAELVKNLHIALPRLDGRVTTLLAREDGRPFNHYSTVFPVPLALTNTGAACAPGTILEPSPLLGATVPDWVGLHFQVDAEAGWSSPQVPAPSLFSRLDNKQFQCPHDNVTPARKQLLAELARAFPARALLAAAHDHIVSDVTLRDRTLLFIQNQRLQQDGTSNTTNNTMNLANQPWLGNQDSKQAQAANPPYANPNDLQQRVEVQSKVANENRGQNLRYNKDVVLNTLERNGENWFAVSPTKAASKSSEAEVALSPMAPFWLQSPAGRDYLLVARLVLVDEKEVCQGMVLDTPALEKELLEALPRDLFPEARLLPVRESEPLNPDRTMARLPYELDPGPQPDLASAGWTPLRVGLAFAWAAALMALAAVGLGGWSLIDLSQRRIRFVSAVTHELRTPLTTLRLYLDMLMNGLVRDERQREEYVRTLHGEADRLNRLVGNVLDFSRLENQRPRLVRAPIAIAELLERLRETWQVRCQDAGKELVVENGLPEEALLVTDAGLVGQVLGNLIDNACKYSRDAADPHLWLRVRREGDRVAFEVEDRGPGIPATERRAIFSAFRRGCGADVTAGGVGLGLALARRWAHLLGGRLVLSPGCAEGGACFRLELPAT